MRRALIAAGLLAASLAAPSAAHAQVEFRGTPTVTFSRTDDGENRSYSLGAVFRLDQAIEDRNDTAVLAAPSLDVGDEVGSTFGGDAPNRIGDASRHCYVVEVRRPRPVSTPRRGARWELGIAVGEDEIEDTVRVRLRRAPNSDWQRPAARRLGCYEDDSSDARASRRRVCDERLEVFEQPGRIYLGALREGQTFGVRRSSPSGTYSYGFAYGNADKLGWVRTSGLCSD
jgi:hypothetical protein